MAIKPMVYVWTTPYSGAKKLMLMAIADRCDDEGVCFPGVDTLAQKCCVEKRAAQSMITSLEKDGEIVVVVGKGTKTKHGPTNLYYMKRYRETIGLPTPTAPARIIQITPKGMQDSTSLKKDGMQNSASQGMQKTTSQGMQNSASNPSVNPSVDPSVKESAAPIGTDTCAGGDIHVTNGDALIKQVFPETDLQEADATTNNSDSVKAQTEDSQIAQGSSSPKLLPRSAAAKKSRPAATAGKEPNPLMEAVVYAFGVDYGYGGKFAQFFMGGRKKDPDKKSDRWVEWQPEPPAQPETLPARIIAFTLWYSQHPSFKDAFAQRNGLPRTPEILRERWDEFNASMQANEKMAPYWMPKAEAVLARLLAGEKIRPQAETRTSVATAHAESASSYKPAPMVTEAYTLRTDDTEIDITDAVNIFA